MPVETQYLDDFSGGEADAISSLELGENQWLLLEGFVFDNARRLRSQWAGRVWSAKEIVPAPEDGS